MASHIERRKFLATLGGAAVAWPLAARAQRLPVPVIGFLDATTAADTVYRVSAFRDGLKEAGFIDGHNVAIEFRWAENKFDRLPALAADLVQRQVAVIVGPNTAMRAVRTATSTIPIVFVNVSDPIGPGFVDSLARPGGRLSGLLHSEAGIFGKWLALLKEIAPHLARAALVANPKNPVYDYFLRSANATAPLIAIELVPGPVENAADIARFFENFARMPDSGLLVPPDVMTMTYRDLIVALAARHRLPAVYSFGLFVTAGGLMSYGTDQVDMFGQTASYIDRILRGAKPADLPVQAPTKYETVLNLKTAKALSLDVPPGLLVAADEVIE